MGTCAENTAWTHNQLIFLRKIYIFLEISLLAYFDIILKIISLCIKEPTYSLCSLISAQLNIKGRAFCRCGAGSLAWEHSSTFLLSEHFSNQEEIHTFICFIHVNEKKLSSDAFTAKTTSGLNNSSLSKRKLNR